MMYKKIVLMIFFLGCSPLYFSEISFSSEVACSERNQSDSDQKIVTLSKNNRNILLLGYLTLSSIGLKVTGEHLRELQRLDHYRQMNGASLIEHVRQLLYKNSIAPEKTENFDSKSAAFDFFVRELLSVVDAEVPELDYIQISRKILERPLDERDLLKKILQEEIIDQYQTLMNGQTFIAKLYRALEKADSEGLSWEIRGTKAEISEKLERSMVMARKYFGFIVLPIFQILELMIYHLNNEKSFYSAQHPTKTLKNYYDELRSSRSEDD